MNIHSVGNAVEAVVWLILAVCVLVAGLRNAPVRSISWAACAALVLFGLSDLVEIRTGAWWRPWWLLVWKGLCVVTLVVLLWGWFRHRNSVEADSDDQPVGPDND